MPCSSGIEKLLFLKWFENDKSDTDDKHSQSHYCGNALFFVSAWDGLFYRSIINLSLGVFVFWAAEVKPDWNMVSEVYNMDCVQFMKHYPDKFFDLAVVDPPYGIDAASDVRGNTQYGKAAAKSKSYGKKDWDKSAPDLEYFYDSTLRSNGHVLICYRSLKKFGPIGIWKLDPFFGYIAYSFEHPEFPEEYH